MFWEFMLIGVFLFLSVVFLEVPLFVAWVPLFSFMTHPQSVLSYYKWIWQYSAIFQSSVSLINVQGVFTCIIPLRNTDIESLKSWQDQQPDIHMVFAHRGVQKPEVIEFQKNNDVLLFAVVCPSGSHFQNGECIPCPLGYYQYQTGRSSCIKCPMGKTTSSYGAFSIDHCKLS